MKTCTVHTCRRYFALCASLPLYLLRIDARSCAYTYISCFPLALLTLTSVSPPTTLPLEACTGLDRPSHKPHGRFPLTLCPNTHINLPHFSCRNPTGLLSPSLALRPRTCVAHNTARHYASNHGSKAVGQRVYPQLYKHSQLFIRTFDANMRIPAHLPVFGNPTGSLSPSLALRPRTCVAHNAARQYASSHGSNSGRAASLSAVVYTYSIRSFDANMRIPTHLPVFGNPTGLLLSPSLALRPQTCVAHNAARQYATSHSISIGRATLSPSAPFAKGAGSMGSGNKNYSTFATTRVGGAIGRGCGSRASLPSTSLTGRAGFAVHSRVARRGLQTESNSQSSGAGEGEKRGIFSRFFRSLKWAPIPVTLGVMVMATQVCVCGCVWVCGCGWV